MAKLYIGDSQGTPAIIKIEEVPKKKFGASVDAFLGDVDENGMYQLPIEFTLDLSSVKSLPAYGLYYKFYKSGVIGVLTIGLEGDFSSERAMEYCFYGCTGLTSIDLGSLTTVSGSNGMYHCFDGCTGLTSIDLSALTTISGFKAMTCGFCGCTGLTSVDLSSLTKVSGNEAIENCFQNCSGLTSVDLSSLATVSGNNAMAYCFGNCASLTTISFPALTSIIDKSFGNSNYNYIFSRTALTEIHFRADMQATIEAITGYANKWGATNATIYFDL